MNKPGILFVDDEPNILSGIKRMLRSLRKDFTFYFAESGNEALEILSQNHIIIIVSDMRMPGMPGDVLLSEIQERFPHTIRMMLTGHAEEESIFRTVGVVHQFLAKPCEPEKLQDILLRATALYNLVTDGHLKGVVSGLGSLPSLPTIYSRLQKVLASPEASADDVAAVIEQDVAMTAKLLQLVNSSFFGLYQRVDSPARAVRLLGLETVKILVLGVQIFSEIKVQSTQLPIESLFTHSVAVAHCSKKIAKEATDDQDLINDCFLAGMVHDIGKLLLISQMNKEYDQVLEQVQSADTSLVDEEYRTLKANHCDIGAYLIGLWGFNGNIVEAVAFHNQIGDYPANVFNAALAVHLADACYYQVFPERAHGPAPQLDDNHLQKLGLTEQAESWLSIAAEYYQSSEEDPSQ